MKDKVKQAHQRMAEQAYKNEELVFTVLVKSDGRIRTMGNMPKGIYGKVINNLYEATKESDGPAGQ